MTRGRCLSFFCSRGTSSKRYVAISVARHQHSVRFSRIKHLERGSSAKNHVKSFTLNSKPLKRNPTEIQVSGQKRSQCIDFRNQTHLEGALVVAAREVARIRLLQVMEILQDVCDRLRRAAEVQAQGWGSRMRIWRSGLRMRLRRGTRSGGTSHAVGVPRL